MIDPITGQSVSEPQEAPRRGRGRPPKSHRVGLEMLDRDPEEGPQPRWLERLDLFRIAAGGRIPRGCPRRVRAE